MTLATQLQTALAPTVAGGAFYGVNTLEANEDTVFPYLVYTRITSSTNNTLLGATDVQNTRVQVDLYCTRVADLDTSEAAVVAAFKAAPFQSLSLSSQDGYEEAIRAFRRSLDFSIWSTN